MAVGGGVLRFRRQLMEAIIGSRCGSDSCRSYFNFVENNGDRWGQRA